MKTLLIAVAVIVLMIDQGVTSILEPIESVLQTAGLILAEVPKLIV